MNGIAARWMRGDGERGGVERAFRHQMMARLRRKRGSHDEDPYLMPAPLLLHMATVPQPFSSHWKAPLYGGPRKGLGGKRTRLLTRGTACQGSTGLADEAATSN